MAVEAKGQSKNQFALAIIFAWDVILSGSLTGWRKKCSGEASPEQILRWSGMSGQLGQRRSLKPVEAASHLLPAPLLSSPGVP